MSTTKAQKELLVELAETFKLIGDHFAHATSLLRQLETMAPAPPIELTELCNDMANATTSGAALIEKNFIKGTEHLPSKVRARYPGICYECGLSIYVGDWIIIQNVGGNSIALHSEHNK